MLVRSPTLTNSDDSSTFSGSRPDSRSAGATSAARRGSTPLAAVAMAAMCSGVVPQHPPTMLTSPSPANSPSTAAIWSGVSSYSPNALGSPALGWQETKQSARRDSSCT